MEHAPLPLYALFSRRRPVDRAITRLMWRRMSTLKLKSGFVVGSVVWPAIAAYRAFRLTRHRNRAFRGELQRHPLLQWFDQLRLAAFYGKPPHIYYRYRLYERSRMREALDFVTPQEFRGVVDATCDEATLELFRDKAKFEAACSARGLPAVGTLRVIRGQSMVVRDGTENGTLPLRNLFVKPLDGIGGRGAQAWVFENAQFRNLLTGETRSPEQLLVELRSASRDQPYIVQPLLRNAAAIRSSLGDTALATVRVFTISVAKGGAEAAYAMFKIPAQNSVVDNIGSGGIGCSVDLKTGRLEEGFSREKLGVVTVDPATGVPLKKVVLPHWLEVVRLAVEAHNSLGKLAFAGWDIGILDEGAMLVEGNTFPSVEAIQQAFGPLVSNDLFLSVFREQSL